MRKRYLRPIPFRRGFGVRTRLRPANFARYREDEDSIEGKTNEEILTQKCATVNRQFFGGDERKYKNDNELIDLILEAIPKGKDFRNAIMAGQQIVSVIEYYQGESERPGSMAVSEPAEILAPYVREYLGIKDEPEPEPETPPQEEQPVEDEQEEPEESKWEGQEFEYADIRVLGKGKASQRSDEEKREHEKEVKELQNSVLGVLENIYKVKSQPDAVSEGPTTTQYEFKLDKSVKIKSIGTDAKKKEIADQLDMTLEKEGIRVRLIPKNGTLAVEIPNVKTESVPLRDVLESPEWLKAKEKMETPAVLGKDTTGKPVFFDIGKTAHGLIAGSSGSGKSVCINSIITSLLFSTTPEDTKLILIDPKSVEFSAYRNMPHLAAPVITNMDEAVSVLNWLIEEMENRYKLMEAEGVEKISEYNKKILNGTDKKKMPRIVCIIDEFGDLMSTHGKVIETLIQRLGQKGRASGIHLILATQRPSAKIIPKEITENLDMRIALRTSDYRASGMIIGESGAEKLLGKGDMLVPDEKGAYKRVQGTWISNDEIKDVVNELILNNGNPEYSQGIKKAIDSGKQDENAPKKRNFFREAFNLFLTNEDKINATFLRAALGVSAKGARKILKGLEDHGYITPPERDTNTRRLLRTTWGSKKTK